MNSTPQIFKERLIKNRLAYFTRDNVPDFDARFKEVGLWCNATAEKHLDRTKETNVQDSCYEMLRLWRTQDGLGRETKWINLLVRNKR